MYKVFLVDDEAATRTGIRESIDWEASGYTLAGEAADGEMALSLMHEVIPDILIADAEMPLMGGLELSRRARQEMPWLKVIILSGHDEFEYAKQAIAAGVDDYLLKPVTSAQLLDALQTISGKITKDRRTSVEALVASVQNISASGKLPLADLNNLPLVEKLRYASSAEVPKFVEEYLNSFDKSAVTSLIFLYYIFIDILLRASKIIEDLGGDPKEVLSGYTDVAANLSENSNHGSMKTLLTSLLEKTVAFRGRSVVSKYSEVLEKAQKFIKENYADRDISLNSVSKEVNISPNHFSMIFSQETGETFISYLTKVRIEKAKELLKTTGLRTTDIGYEVGYNDLHYFSHVFKKQTGTTPKEFRSK
ncbi:MAG: response regulator [Oscillospiraceae bacterium]|nr:response regulator [Oscillospiraceae bacterium]